MVRMLILVFLIFKISLAQASIVAPVVKTSSIIRMCFPIIFS